MPGRRLARFAVLAVLVSAGCGDAARPAARATAVPPVIASAVASVELDRTEPAGATTRAQLRTGEALDRVAALLPATLPPTTADPPAPCEGCPLSTLLIATADGAVRAWVFAGDDPPASLGPAVAALTGLLR